MSVVLCHTGSMAQDEKDITVDASKSKRKVKSMRSMNQRKSRPIDLDVNLSFPLLLECERDHCRVIVSDFAGSPEILAMLTIVMSEAWNSLMQNIMLSRRMELSS